MLFSKINIERQMVKERDRETSLMEEVDKILQLSSDKDLDVLQRLKLRTDSLASLPFSLEEMDKKNVFSLEDIRTICVRYRLRFLDPSLFKAEIPYQAISNIQAFEKKYDHKIEKFKMIAPDNVFKLQDVNRDPLLLAELGDNTYYLVHKWGSDLSWFRNILCFPFRSIYSFLISCFCLGLAVGFSLPVSWLNVPPENEIYLRVWLSVHSFIGLTGFFIFVGAAFNKSFSGMNWKSHYYNG